MCEIANLFVAIELHWAIQWPTECNGEWNTILVWWNNCNLNVAIAILRKMESPYFYSWN